MRTSLGLRVDGLGKLGHDVARRRGSAAHDLLSGDSITTEEKHGLGGSASTQSDISGPLKQMREMTILKVVNK